MSVTPNMSHLPEEEKSQGGPGKQVKPAADEAGWLMPQALGGALNSTFTLAPTPAQPPATAIPHPESLPMPSASAQMAASSHLNHRDSLHPATQTLFLPREVPHPPPAHPSTAPVVVCKCESLRLHHQCSNPGLASYLLCDLQQVTSLLCASSAKSMK